MKILSQFGYKIRYVESVGKLNKEEDRDEADHAF